MEIVNSRHLHLMVVPDLVERPAIAHRRQRVVNFFLFLG
jgi:hypothetical protein